MVEDKEWPEVIVGFHEWGQAAEKLDVKVPGIEAGLWEGQQQWMRGGTEGLRDVDIREVDFQGRTCSRSANLCGQCKV